MINTVLLHCLLSSCLVGLNYTWLARCEPSADQACECFAGVTFAFELLLSWNVAFVATHNLRKRIVLKRSKIAQFYVWHSTFIFDFISTMVFIVQVRTYVAHKAACIKDCWFSRLDACAVCVHVHSAAQGVAAIFHQHQRTAALRNMFQRQHCQADKLFAQLIWLYTTCLSSCIEVLINSGHVNIRHFPQKCVRFLLNPHQPHGNSGTYTTKSRSVMQCIGYGLGSAGTGSGTIIQVIQILRALR